MTARQIAKLRGLSGRERGILLRALVLLPLARAALRVFGLRRVTRWLDAPARAPRAGAVAAARIGALVATAAGHAPFGSSCLARSLVLSWLLRREGIDGELRIGVRLVDAGLDAHAWVESGGVPLNEPADVAARYTALAKP